MQKLAQKLRSIFANLNLTPEEKDFYYTHKNNSSNLKEDDRDKFDDIATKINNWHRSLENDATKHIEPFFGNLKKAEHNLENITKIIDSDLSWEIPDERDPRSDYGNLKKKTLTEWTATKTLVNNTMTEIEKYLKARLS